MSPHSCSLHGQLFSFTRQCWLPFAEDKIQEIKVYAALRRATNIEAFSLTAIETSGDACAATFRHIAQISGSTDGLRPGER